MNSFLGIRQADNSVVGLFGVGEYGSKRFFVSPQVAKRAQICIVATAVGGIQQIIANIPVQPEQPDDVIPPKLIITVTVNKSNTISIEVHNKDLSLQYAQHRQEINLESIESAKNQESINPENNQESIKLAEADGSAEQVEETGKADDAGRTEMRILLSGEQAEKDPGLQQMENLLRSSGYIEKNMMDSPSEDLEQSKDTVAGSAEIPGTTAIPAADQEEGDKGSNSGLELGIEPVNPESMLSGEKNSEGVLLNGLDAPEDTAGSADQGMDIAKEILNNTSDVQGVPESGLEDPLSSDAEQELSIDLESAHSPEEEIADTVEMPDALSQASEVPLSFPEEVEESSVLPDLVIDADAAFDGAPEETEELQDGAPQRVVLTLDEEDPIHGNTDADIIGAPKRKRVVRKLHKIISSPAFGMSTFGRIISVIALVFFFLFFLAAAGYIIFYLQTMSSLEEFFSDPFAPLRISKETIPLVKP